jgi:hypothetical protein
VGSKVPATAGDPGTGRKSSFNSRRPATTTRSPAHVNCNSSRNVLQLRQTVRRRDASRLAPRLPSGSTNGVSRLLTIARGEEAAVPGSIPLAGHRAVVAFADQIDVPVTEVRAE